MSSVFEGMLSTPPALEALGAHSWVAAMLRFEAALAQAQAELGLIPPGAAQSIVGSCKVELFDAGKIVRESARAGSLALPLVRALKEAVHVFNPQAVPYVHFGSSSQDLIDTAMALIARDMLVLVEDDVRVSAQALLALASAHADTPMLARTLLQPASVTSFGLTCVQWAAPLVRSLQRLAVARTRGLQVQLGGAVDTLARLGVHGPEVRRRVAARLGLGAPLSPWPTQRDEWVALGCELGLLVGSLGTIAKDLALLGQFEIGELTEPHQAAPAGPLDPHFPHKPAGSMVALVAAQRAPQRVAALLASMPQEHERALGAWQVELAEWAQLLVSAHASARALANVLPGLQIQPQRMRAHIDAVAASLPRETAQQWFDPGLAQRAGAQARACVQALRASPAASGADTVPAGTDVLFA